MMCKNRSKRKDYLLRKVLKPVFFFITGFLFIHVYDLQAQMTMEDYLRQKFLSYCDKVPREEIFIQTDREEYIAGEDLWLSTYLVNRQSLRTTKESSIVYFELLNPENRPVIQKRIGLKDGYGPGQIVLPDTLTTGTYTIRAYTNWMRNFLPYNCFMKDIRIYNALSSKKFKEHEKPDANRFVNTERTLTSVSREKDISLSIKRDLPGLLNIIVVTKQNYRSNNNNLCYIFIQTRGKVDLVKAELLAGDSTKISVPEAILSPGINQVTLFDLKGLPVCEQYLYTPAKKEIQLALSTVDSSGLRDKVKVEMNLAQISPALLKDAHLSISVSPAVNYDSDNDIESYLLFGTEFGINRWNLIRDKSINEISIKEMDSILINVHSNWIDWLRIVASGNPDFKYSFETENQYFSGTLLSNDKNSSVADKYIFMSVPGKTAVFQYAKTDKEGNFSFRLHVDEAIKDLVIQPEKEDQSQTIKIESAFSDQFFTPGNIIESTEIIEPGYIGDWSASYQVRKIYEIMSTGPSLPPLHLPLIPKRFYGKPDDEIKLADYIRLPVMQEVFFELMVGAFLKEKKSAYEITISDPVDNKIYDTPPLLMIDGVIIKDPAEIANLDPELVEKIDVERERYMVGDYLFHGIVNIITVAGDFSNGTLPPEAVSIPYRVLDPVLSFKSPDYSDPVLMKDHIPDFRTTLYWNPSLVTGKDGKVVTEFWTSDYASEYEINIQGVTTDGIPVSIRKKFRVR